MVILPDRLDIACPSGGPMSAANQLKRHQEIYLILKNLDESTALTLTEILKELPEGYEVDRKTIERDIDQMSSTHRIVETGTYPNRFFADKNFKVDYQFNFTDAELQTIVLALQNLYQTSPDYLRNLCSQTETSLIDKLPDPLKKDLKEFKELHHFNYGINGRDQTLFDEKNNNDSCKVALEALREGKTFTCNYASIDKPESIKKVRHFEPQLFQLTGSIGYLYVRDFSDGVLKNLRMSRITNAKLQVQKAKRLPKKEIKGLKSSFGGFGLGDEKTIEIKIKCDKHMATAFGERVIHDSQQIKKGSNEEYHIILKMAPTSEIHRLLAGWNNHIFEISPEILKTEVKKISGVKI